MLNLYQTELKKKRNRTLKPKKNFGKVKSSRKIVAFAKEQQITQKWTHNMVDKTHASIQYSITIQSQSRLQDQLLLLFNGVNVDAHVLYGNRKVSTVMSQYNTVKILKNHKYLHNTGLIQYNTTITHDT